MRELLSISVAALGVLVLHAPMRAAQADWWAELYQVQCIPELDVLELRPFHVNSEIAVHAVEQRNDRLEKEHGLFVPQWHYRDNDDSVRYDFRGVLVNLDGYVRWPARFDCPLSVGLVELIIYPEPLSDESGWLESISVSMLVNDRLILHDIPFRRCEDNASIYELVYEGGKFRLSGRFGWMASRIGDMSAKALRGGIKTFRVEAGPIEVSASYGNSSKLDLSRYTPPLMAEDVLNPAPPPHVRGEEESYHCEYRGPSGLTPYRERQVW